MSEEEKHLTFDEIKDRKPKRLGFEVGYDGQNYVVAVDEEKAFALTTGAYYIWTICDGARTVEQMIEYVSEELSKNPETAMSTDELKEPITVILEQLEKAGLVEL